MRRLALASAPNHSLAPPTFKRMKIPAAAIAHKHSSVKVISSEMRRHAAVFAQAL
jgi:hypothetical protein